MSWELGVLIFSPPGAVGYSTEDDDRAVCSPLKIKGLKHRGAQRKTLRSTEGTGVELNLYAQALSHGLVEEALAGAVGLDPLAVDDELWDRAFAGTFHDFFESAGGGLNVDFFVGNVVLGEEALGLAAIGAPGR